MDWRQASTSISGGGQGAKGFEVFRRCWDHGVLIRVTGDIIALSPPFVVQEDQIDQIFDTVTDALRQA